VKDSPRKKLIKNAAQCLNCNDIIESKHRHDFVSCKCGELCVDGGLDYLRRVGNINMMKDLSEYKEQE